MHGHGNLGRIADRSGIVSSLAQLAIRTHTVLDQEQLPAASAEGAGEDPLRAHPGTPARTSMAVRSHDSS